MTAPPGIPADYELLEARLKTLLPEQYQDSYADVQSAPMGSADLKYAADGRVAWDEIWASFCDLALAGGPPHRGTLLQPATQADIDQDPHRYNQVLDELCRGVEMVSGLAAEPSSTPGWIHVDCPSTSMAGWLVRAINMENVSAHVAGMVLHLPAGPGFRLEKEIKNVIVSIAKTCHYWLGHTSVRQHRAIADLFKTMELESPLIQAPFPPRNPPASSDELGDIISQKIQAQTGSHATGREYPGWLGIDRRSARSAIWIMRVIAATNVLCRREGNLVYLPVNPSADPNGDRIAQSYTRAHRLALTHGVA